MLNHENICDYNKVTCSYCNNEFSQGTLNNHLTICECKPVKCNLCDALVRQNELEKHKEENSFCRRFFMKIKEIESLIHENQELKNINSEQNIKVKELQRHNEQNTNNIMTLKNKNNELFATNLEIKESEEFQKNEVERLTKRIMEIEGKLKEKNENHEKLLIENNKILDNLVKENQNLKLETKNLKNDLSYVIDQKKSIEINEEEARKELSSLTSKNYDQSLTINGLLKRIEDNNKNITDMEKLIKHLNDEIRSLEVIKNKLIKKIKNPEKDGKGNDDDDFEI